MSNKKRKSVFKEFFLAFVAVYSVILFIMTPLLWYLKIISFKITLLSFGFLVLTWIILYAIFNPLIAKEIFFSILEGLYTKKLKDAMFKAQNFLRPIAKHPIGTYVFANKNCIVELHDNVIYFYDKLSKSSIMKVITKYRKKSIFVSLCESITYDTTFADIKTMMSEFENKNLLSKNAGITTYNDAMFSKISLNDISVAELVCIPGINIGKANKIYKYIKTKDFKTKKQFIDYADINPKYKKEFFETHNFHYNYSILPAQIYNGEKKTKHSRL